jgi:membrane complex biogenesis BtpA family protein
MSFQFVSEKFGKKKPIIAMAHIPALPGTPRYDDRAGIYSLIEKTVADVECLVTGGVDAIMFCNEDDRPYVFEATMEQVAAMTRVITEARPKSMHYGVDFLWDPKAALCIAFATGASFIREVVTGTYESDMGLWSPRAGDLLRYRRYIGAEDIGVFFNIVPEFASAMGTRTVAERARSMAVSSLPDAILVSGSMAGSEPDLSIIKEVKGAVGAEFPVFLNTGAKASNITEYLDVADGVIVGSSLKVDGYTWNPVDPERVREFVERANGARG